MPYGKSLHISGNIVDRMSKRVLMRGDILPCYGLVKGCFLGL